jgi:hypothetical protein
MRQAMIIAVIVGLLGFVGLGAARTSSAAPPNDLGVYCWDYVHPVDATTHVLRLNITALQGLIFQLHGHDDPQWANASGNFYVTGHEDIHFGVYVTVSDAGPSYNLWGFLSLSTISGGAQLEDAAGNMMGSTVLNFLGANCPAPAKGAH